MQHHEPRHCFAHAYFWSLTETIVCEFTEGEIYSYTGCPATAWAEFKGDVTRGHDWNVAAIAFTRGNPNYAKISSVPTGFDDAL